MKEIAKITGLSIATVSHALNGTRKVSSKSQKLVQDAAEKIGYKPSLAAQILRTQKSGIIGLIIPSSHPTNDTNSFYFGVLNGARAALDSRGYDMIISTYPEDKEQVDFSSLQLLQTRIVEGLLVVPFSSEKTSLESLGSLKVPVVLLDRTVEDTSFPLVRSDNYNATKEMISAFADSGKKRIAFLGGKTTYSTVQERLLGYRKVLEEHGLPYDEKLVYTNFSDNESEGYRAAKALLKEHVDAIFIENSMLMIGVIAYCQEHNINIPKTLALAGFDNAPWMTVTTPPLTAIQQSAESIGEQGANLLLDIIEEKEDIPNEIIIPTELILRKSHN